MDVRDPMEIALSEAYYRYIYTLPLEDQEPSRFMVHLQHAYKFFRDELQGKLDLPNLSLPVFVACMQERFQFLKEYTSKELMDIYDSYRSRIPIRGAVLLNPTFDKILCVYNLKHKHFTFPRGKVNQGESDTECAIRQVSRTVGFDLGHLIHPEHFLESNEGLVKLFIVENVPENLHFPTHKHSQPLWVHFADIPTKMHRLTSPYKHFQFNKVFPFLPKLKKWIRKKNQFCAASLQKSNRGFSNMCYFYREFKLDSNKILCRIDQVLEHNS